MAAGDSTDTNDERYANVLAMVQAGVASGPCWCIDDRQSPPPWPPTLPPLSPADGSITWLMESTLPHDEGDEDENEDEDKDEDDDENEDEEIEEERKRNILRF